MDGSPFNVKVDMIEKIYMSILNITDFFFNIIYLSRACFAMVFQICGQASDTI